MGVVVFVVDAVVVLFVVVVVEFSKKGGTKLFGSGFSDTNKDGWL